MPLAPRVISTRARAYRSRPVTIGGAVLVAAIGAATLANAPAAQAGGAVAASASLGTNCTGTAYLYGVRPDGKLTFSAVDAATNKVTRSLVGADLGVTLRSLATLNYNTALATTSTGGLVRIDVTGNTKRLVATFTRMGSTGWTYDKLAFDGAGHLFATTATGVLFRYAVTSAKPTGSQVTDKIRIGTGFTLTSLAATGGSQLIGTTSSGKLMGYRAAGQGNVTTATLASSGYSGVDKVAAAGGGMFFARTKTSGSLVTRRDVNVGDGSGSDITTIGTLASSGWTQKLVSAAPKTVKCTGGSTGGSLTYAALVGMFGQSWVGTQSVVEQGLPSLQGEMTKGSITNSARMAAFLATLVSESAMRWDADQGGSYTYHGRGYIQLTNDFNYDSAGDYFGVDLLGNPELARSLTYSAPIARWYWTVARTTTNAYADDHNMDGVNRNIGFAWNYDEATRRCDRFKSAYKYLTGSLPTNTICYPSKLPAEGSWYGVGPAPAAH